MLTPETLITPGGYSFPADGQTTVPGRAGFSLALLHPSLKPVQWECERVGFICSKVRAACTPLIKYVALQLLKSVTTIHMDCKGDMKLYLKN